MKNLFLAIILFIVLSGCTASSSNDSKQLQEIELRYMGRGTIAPATITDIDLMAKELQDLKQKSSFAVQEMIGIRMELLSFTRSYLEAQSNIARISPQKGGCEEQDALKQAIGKLDEALGKGTAAKARIRAFKANNPSLLEQSNISLGDFEAFEQTTKNLKNNMQKFYTEACTAVQH